MANKIQVRRGLKAKLPVLSAGEPALATDTKEFFIGTDSGNKQIATKEESVQKSGDKIEGSLEVTEQIKAKNTEFTGSNGIYHSHMRNYCVNRYLGKTSGAYIRTVILLHEAYNSALLDANYVVGEINLYRGASGAAFRLSRAKIVSGSAYNNTDASLEESNHYTTESGYLATCMYEGVKYMCYVIPYRAAEFASGFNFTGWARSTKELLKVVDYYNDQTGAVLNAEIHNSLTVFTSTIEHTIPFHTKLRSGKTDYAIAGIQEEGNNANGNYIRFTNGLQICWRRTELSAIINTAQGSMYKMASNQSWTYPATFSSSYKPAISNEVGSTVITGLYVTSLYDGEVLKYTFNILSASSITTTTNLLLMQTAIGRWK